MDPHARLNLQGRLRHRKGPIVRLVAASEAGRVNKDAAVDTGDLAELLVAHATPGLREGLAVTEPVERDRDGRDAPIVGRVILVEHVNGGARGPLLGLELEEMLLGRS